MEIAPSVCFNIGGKFNVYSDPKSLKFFLFLDSFSHIQ